MRLFIPTTPSRPRIPPQRSIRLFEGAGENGGTGECCSCRDRSPWIPKTKETASSYAKTLHPLLHATIFYAPSHEEFSEQGREAVEGNNTVGAELEVEQREEQVAEEVGRV